MDTSSGKLREMIVKDREAWRAVVHAVAESGELCSVTEQQLVNSPLNVTVELRFSFSMQIHFEPL